jgi:hypothetical protein
MAMNRDEKIARGTVSPPEIHEFEGARAIYPNDGNGGTWIAVNEYGIALALLNWNGVAPSGKTAKTRSRGLVIPTLIDSRSLSDLHEVFSVSNFKGMLPFRLIGVFPSERKIGEWRWDSGQTRFALHQWEPRHWFSSSLSDNQAENLRGIACRNAWNQADAGSGPWLRRLHTSHNDASGPFSLCVHRPEVRTLSYSEIECTPTTLRIKHFPGSPCLALEDATVNVERGHTLYLRTHGSEPAPTN